jgi:hypothetical protein
MGGSAPGGFRGRVSEALQDYGGAAGADAPGTVMLPRRFPPETPRCNLWMALPGAEFVPVTSGLASELARRSDQDDQPFDLTDSLWG